MTGHDCKNGIDGAAGGERIVSRLDIWKTPEAVGAYRYAVDALNLHLIGGVSAKAGRKYAVHCHNVCNVNA